MDFLSDDEGDLAPSRPTRKPTFSPIRPGVSPIEPNNSHSGNYESIRYPSNSPPVRQQFHQEITQRQAQNTTQVYANPPAIKPRIIPAPQIQQNYHNYQMPYHPSSPVQQPQEQPQQQLTREQLMKKALSRALQKLERLPDDKKNFGAGALKDFMKQAKRILPPQVMAKIKKYATNEMYLKYHKNTNPRQKRVILASIYMLIGEQYYLSCIERSYSSSKQILRLSLESLKSLNKVELFHKTSSAIKNFRLNNKNFTDLLNFVFKFIQRNDEVVFAKIIESLRTGSVSNKQPASSPIVNPQTQPTHSFTEEQSLNAQSIKRSFSDASKITVTEKRRSPVPKQLFSHNRDLVNLAFETAQQVIKIPRISRKESQHQNGLIPLTFVEGLVLTTLQKINDDREKSARDGVPLLEFITKESREISNLLLSYITCHLKSTICAIQKEKGTNVIGVNSILYHNGLLNTKQTYNEKLYKFLKTEELKKKFQAHLQNLNFLHEAKYEEINQISAKRSELPDSLSKSRLKIKKDILKNDKKSPGIVERQVDIGLKQCIQQFLTDVQVKRHSSEAPTRSRAISLEDIQSFLSIRNPEEEHVAIRESWKLLLAEYNDI